MPARIEIVILAGGLSSRMGRDKSRIRLGGRTLLQHIRSAAAETGWPVQTVRRDVVPRCGPLGGVLTALQHARSEVVILLSCDMPFVSPASLRRLVRALAGRQAAAFFVSTEGGAGFPFALRRDAREKVTRLIERKQFSLQALARTLAATRLPIPRRRAWAWLNVNTPEDLGQARQIEARQRRLVSTRKAGIVTA